MSRTLKARNSRLRFKFKLWHSQNYAPNIRRVAESANMSYGVLRLFISGHRDLGETNLDKLEGFLDKHTEKQKITN